MAKYRKKPVVIEAVLWGPPFAELPGWIEAGIASGKLSRPPGDCLHIQTLEGVMVASPGDWIILGVVGEMYPCKPDIFERTYEPAEALYLLSNKTASV